MSALFSVPTFTYGIPGSSVALPRVFSNADRPRCVKERPPVHRQRRRHRVRAPAREPVRPIRQDRVGTPITSPAGERTRMRARTAQEDPRLELRFEARPDAVAKIRRQLAAFAAHYSVEESVDLSLAVS